MDAVRGLGLGDWRIIMQRVVPNMTAPYLINLTAGMGQAILLEAFLLWPGGATADPCPGADALARCRTIRGAGAVAPHISRAGHYDVGVRIHPLRRLTPGRAGPQTPHLRHPQKYFPSTGPVGPEI